MVFYYLFREQGEIKLSKFFFKKSSLLRDITIKGRIAVPISFNENRLWLNDKAKLLAFKEGLERQIAEVSPIEVTLPTEEEIDRSIPSTFFKIQAEKEKKKKIKPPEDKFIWHVFGDFTNITPPVGIDFYTEDEGTANDIKKRFEDKYGHVPEIDRDLVPDFGIIDDSFIYWHDKNTSKQYEVTAEI